MNIYLDIFCNCDRSVANVNQAGEISEIVFTLAAVREGYTVFTPHTHNTKIDIILHKQGMKPITCQVKKGTRLKDNSRPTYKVLVGSAKSSNGFQVIRHGIAVIPKKILISWSSTLASMVFHSGASRISATNRPGGGMRINL